MIVLTCMYTVPKKALKQWCTEEKVPSMASGHVLYRSAFALFLIFLLSWAGIDNYKFDDTGHHQAGVVICVQPQAVVCSTSNLCCGCLAFVHHLGSPCALHRLVRIHFLGRRLLYSSNGTFNPSVIRIALGGDVHPQPGPSLTLHGSSTARTLASEMSVFPKNAHLNIKIAHLNVRSLKSRENFILVKDAIQSAGFDIFTISETWLDSSVTDAFVYVPGYSLFRQDRGPQKASGGLCVYTRDTLKVEYIEKLSSATSNGFQQLWLKIQTRSCKSFLLNTVYRPPSAPVKFFDDLTQVFIDSLLCGLDIFVISDLNCNLLSDDYESRACLDFCTTFNLTQLINSPTRITECSQSLIDVIMTTNKEIVTHHP